MFYFGMIPSQLARACRKELNINKLTMTSRDNATLVAEKKNDFDNFFIRTVNPIQNSFQGFYYTCFE